MRRRHSWELVISILVCSVVGLVLYLQQQPWLVAGLDLAIVGIWLWLTVQDLRDMTVAGAYEWSLVVVALGLARECLCNGHISGSLIGLVVGFGLWSTIRYLGRLAFKQEALGDGDPLLMGAVGAVSGWQGVLLVTAITSITGAIGGVVCLWWQRKLAARAALPLFPFIVSAAIVTLLWRDQIVGWYLNLNGLT